MQKPQLKTSPAKILWLPVTAGFLVDNILSAAANGIGQWVDPVVMGKATNSTFASTTGIVVWLVCILATGIGGLVAGRMARRERVMHGILVGGLGIGVMLLSGIFGSATQYNGLDLTLQFTATLLAGIGGWLSHWLPNVQADA